jgi:hypothetical protein
LDIQILVRLYGIIRGIKLASDFAKGAHELVGTKDMPLEHLPEDEVEWLRSCVRAILKTCKVSFVLCGVLIPLGLPWVRWLGGSLSARFTSQLMLGGAVAMGLFWPASLILGVSLGCLFAPDRFLISPLGRKWLDLIGTQSVLGARMASGFGVFLVGCLVLLYCVFVFAAVNR